MCPAQWAIFPGVCAAKVHYVQPDIVHCTLKCTICKFTMYTQKGGPHQMEGIKLLRQETVGEEGMKEGEEGRGVGRHLRRNGRV